MRSLATLLLLSLAACGARGQLEPAEGVPLPVKPYGALATPTPEELLTATPQQRPARSDELLRSSEERPNDPFELPPR